VEAAAVSGGDLAPCRASPAPRGQRAGEAGFTLIELAVATVVMLLALLLACDLLDESGRLLAHSARRARDAQPLLATELLRNDLRAALPVVPPGLWSSDALELDRPTFGAATWQLAGDVLERIAAEGGQPLLRGVAGWRWRALPGGAVEVEIRLRASGTWLSQARQGPPRADPGGEERILLLVAPRGGLTEW
jgi:hypothetical protein